MAKEKVNVPIPKETARQVLLMLKGIEGIDIQANNEYYYPTKDSVDIEHVLERMGYEKEDLVKREI